MNEQNKQEATEIYVKLYKAATKALQDVGDVEVLSPAEIDNHRVRLAALFALLNDELARIEIEHAKVWITLKTMDDSGEPRQKPLSDNMTDKMVDSTTEIGRMRLESKYLSRGLDKVISALAARMRRINDEVRNNF